MSAQEWTWRTVSCLIRYAKLLTRCTLLSVVFAMVSSPVNGATNAGTPWASRPLGHYNSVTYRTLDGLVQNVIKDVLQTRDGYIWVATQEGISRFDGASFTNLDTNNTPGLATNNMQQVLQDGNGDVWFAGYGGISCLHHGVVENVRPPSSGSRSYYPVQCQVDRSGVLWESVNATIARAEGRKLVPVFDLSSHASGTTIDSWAVALDGALWVVASDNSIYHVGKKLEVYHLARSGQQVMGNMLAVDKQGRVWDGVGRTLYRFDGVGFRLIADSRTFPDDIRNLLADSSGDVWAVAGGLFRMLGDAPALVHRPITNSAQNLATGTIERAYLNHKGELVYIWYDGAGKYRISLREGGQFTVLPGAASIGWLVNGLVRDSEGNLWLGSNDGLTEMRPAMCRTLGESDGLPSNEITSVCEGRDGAVYVAVSGRGLYVRRNGTFSRYNDSVPLVLVQSPTGALYSIKNGSNLYHELPRRSVRADAEFGIPNESTGTLLFDSTGRSWVTTTTQFVSVKNGHVTRYPLPAGKHWFFVSLVDHLGRFWASGVDGLYCLDNGKVRIYTAADGLPPVMISSLYEDREGTLWLGHWGNGITRFANGRFDNVSIRDGLHADGIYEILGDHRSNLWIGSSKGVFSVDRNLLNRYIDTRRGHIKCIAYDEMDGVVDGPCSAGSNSLTVRTRDGVLWFATTKGVVCVDTTAVDDPSVQAYVEGVVIHGHDYSVDGPLVIPPGHSDVEFHFTGLDFRYPSKLSFRYLLEGYDHQWNESGNRRQAFYTNLPFGHYRFRVLCTNNAGQVSQAETPWIEFRPFFYQTLWFKFLVAAAVLSMVCAYFVTRNCRLRQYNRELEARVDERTAELRNSNDLLEGMQAELEIQNQDLIDSQRALADQNEELNTLKEELLANNSTLVTVNHQLQAFATTDGLTGLLNHRSFHDALENSYRKWVDHAIPFALVMMDVDFFKQYNDTYGHPAGDDVLSTVGRLLKGVVRDSDVVGRYGGEEFGVLIGNTDPAHALQMAERLRLAIEQNPWTLRAVTVSVGVATVGHHIDTHAAIVDMADAALYSSKHNGKNRVTVADPMSIPASRRR